MNKTAVVGMSGGVDSSVSAWILKQQGYNVIGLFMKNWEEQDGTCNASAEFEDVVRVCQHIGIPYYSVNFTQEYKESVFEQFLTDYAAGLTPNPDVLCNREIKFKVFLEKAMAFGADFLATGHYCQTDGNGKLLKGKDPNKDQSYFLHAVKGEALKKVLFPLGHLMKSEVREIARQQKLPTAEKKDSTGICFIGKRDFKPFLSSYLKQIPGNMETGEGKVVGRHDGVQFYTIGQRKGLGLGGEGEPWFVVGKDVKRNVLVVERGENHPALFTKRLLTKELTWVVEKPSLPLKCKAKVRYRQSDQACTLLETGEVVFDDPQRAVTPGQFVVFYDDEVCLGGGVIEDASP